MKVWLINPFDPLPGEKEQLGRYGHLAYALRDAGHEVTWWSSDFSHRFKRNVDAAAIRSAANARGMDIRLVPTPRYSKNISLARLKSHAAYAREFARTAAMEPKPDIILASSPPLGSAAEAAKFGEGRGISTVIDIQDQWPDNFRRLFPKPLRWLGGLLLSRQYSLEHRAYRLAKGIVGVAEGYVRRGITVGGLKEHRGVFPLGVTLDEVDATFAAGRKKYGGKWQKGKDEIWFLYSGSLSHAYDFLTIVRAAIQCQEKFGTRARFFLSGQGELSTEAERIVREYNLSNVTLTGFLEFEEWVCLLSQADAGFNASFPHALIYFPNKIFYYMAAGAAILNTIPGECAELVEREGCGLNYRAGDAEDCFRTIARLMDDPTEAHRMGKASRRLAETRYDRAIISAAFVRFLEGVVNRG